MRPFCPRRVVWAAVEKSPGFTPEGLIAEIRRNANYPAADWRALLSSEPIDPKDIASRLRSALDEAESFVTGMPTDKMGLLFLKGGQVVQPDPARLPGYQTHAGQRAVSGQQPRNHRGDVRALSETAGARPPDVP